MLSASLTQLKHRPGLLFFLVSLLFTVFEFSFKLTQGFILAPEDGFVQNYPGFAAGGFLWTPLILTGFPVAADPQLAIFYPLRALCALFPAAFGFNLYVLSAFFLASFFASLYCHRLTGSILGGLVGGTLYGFGGYQISELRHVQVLHSALWLPLLLLLVDHLRSAVACASRLKFTLILIGLTFAFASCVLAGHPQTAAYVIVCVLAYCLLGLLCFASGRFNWNIKKQLPVFAGAALSLAFAMLLSCVQLLPSLELASQSARASLGYKDFISGELELSQICGFMIPYLLGPKYGSLDGLPFAEQGPPPGLLFYGIGGLLLAALAWRKRGGPAVLFFIGLIPVCFFVALGEHNGIAPLLYKFAPFNYFRELYRVLLLVALAISVLAAFGVSSIGPSKSNARPLLSYLRDGTLKHHLYLAFYIFLCLLVPPMLPGTLPLILLYRRTNGFTAALLLLSLYAVSLNYAWLSQWYAHCPKLIEFSPPADAALLQEELRADHERIFTLKGLEASPAAFPPNLNRLWGVPSATGYEPLVPVRYRDLLDISEGGFLRPPWRIDQENRVFDICSVRYFLAPEAEFGPAAFHGKAADCWPLRKTENGVLTYENVRCLPRFRLVNKVKKLADSQICSVIRSGHFSDGSVFSPADTALVDSIASREWAVGKSSVSAVKVQDESIELSVDSENPIYLVIADQFYPGWRAYVDGQRQEIVRTNYVQRGLPLEKGAHKIRLVYGPESFRIGSWISIFALSISLSLLLTTLFIMVKRRQRISH